MRAKWVWASLAVLSPVTPAHAEDCNKPLQIIASLPLTDWGTNSVTIPVSLDGVEKQFLFDTGGAFTQISPATAKELNLTMKPSAISMTGEDGASLAYEVYVPDFAIGPLQAKNYKIPVSPHNEIAGLFSPVAFKFLDFEVDFSAHKLNIFSNDHCDGKVVYWPSKTFGVVPFFKNGDHIIVQVAIDGHTMNAMVDTGQTYTTIFLNKDTETAFGLDPASPDMKVVGHIGNNENAPIYSHPFKTLAFGNVVVTNPHTLIFTDINNNNWGGHRPTVPIIGMDVLRKLHLFLALKEQKLYLTEASAPVAAPAAAPATAPTVAPADTPN